MDRGVHSLTLELRGGNVNMESQGIRDFHAKRWGVALPPSPPPLSLYVN